MDLFVDIPFHGFFQEGQEVFAVSGGLALTEDFAGSHVQRREQIRRTMSQVVMGAFLGRIDGDRQHRLGPILRLDLRLFIQGQHHRSAGRVEVEPDDVGDLLEQTRNLCSP